MRKTITMLGIFVAGTIVASAQTNIFPNTGSAGIGTTAPNASSILEIKSTTKGLLIPRMTKAQRDGIATPAAGLMIYQTNGNLGFYFYDGTAWKQINYSRNSTGWALSGNSGTNPATNFIGTADANALLFRVNNEKAGVIGYDFNNSNTGFGYKTIKASASGSYSYNTAFGSSTLFNNTSGFGNTATGNNALYNNLAAYDNTAIGFSALQSNTTGNSNTAAGINSLISNTSGSSNTAIGTSEMFSIPSGNSNTVIGTNSLTVSTTYIYRGISDEINATSQTAAGCNTLATVDNNELDTYINGPCNTALGVDALHRQVGERFGGYNTAIGYSASEDEEFSNSSMIGSYADIFGSNEIIVGDENNSINSIGGHVSWSVFTVPAPKSIQENVPGIAFIKLLRPVTYNLDYAAFRQLRKVQNNMPGLNNSKTAETKNFTGFIAQEASAAAKKLNYDFSGIDNTESIMRLRYSEFTVPLIKAVQELSSVHDSLIVQNIIIQQNLQQKISEQAAELLLLRNTLLASLLDKSAEPGPALQNKK